MTVSSPPAFAAPLPVSAPARETEASREIAVRVEDLHKSYRLGARREGYRTLRETLSAAAAAPLRRLTGPRDPDPERTVWALDGVCFEIRRGEVVGIIGRNGAGKSTLLKVLSRITEPTRGFAEIHGRVGSLLEVGTGFHPELTGRENIFLNGAILGMRRAEIRSKFDEIVAFAEIARFLDTPVKHYSSGMYLRLAFAVAAHLEPEILLVDEVLAVGDAAFQRKCLGKMEDVARAGRTVLFVSHNMGAVRSLCTKGLVLDGGRLAESGEIERCIESYFKMIGAFGESAGDAPAARRGSCGFGRVSLTGARPGPVLQSDPLEAQTTLTIAQEVSGFSLFCIVEDMQNRMVFHLREESPSLGLARVAPGDYAIGVVIPPLWLNSGLYSLSFKVLLWGVSDDARHVSDKFPLDVTGRHSRVDALLHPESTWTVRPL